MPHVEVGIPLSIEPQHPFDGATVGTLSARARLCGSVDANCFLPAPRAGYAATLSTGQIGHFMCSRGRA